MRGNRSKVLGLGLSSLVCLAGCRHEQEYEPSYSHTGRELVFVYVGASDCPPCRSKELKGALKQVKSALAHRAAENDQTFAAIGVSLDGSIEAGIAFLEECGQFDELSVGRSWHNSVFAEHVWRADSRFGVIPQVIVYEQDVSEGTPGLSVGPPRYLARRHGSTRIAEWVREGAPFEEGV